MTSRHSQHDDRTRQEHKDDWRDAALERRRKVDEGARPKSRSRIEDRLTYPDDREADGSRLSTRAGRAPPPEPLRLPRHSGHDDRTERFDNDNDDGNPSRDRNGGDNRNRERRGNGAGGWGERSDRWTRGSGGGGGGRGPGGFTSGRIGNDSRGHQDGHDDRDEYDYSHGEGQARGAPVAEGATRGGRPGGPLAGRLGPRDEGTFGGPDREGDGDDDDGGYGRYGRHRDQHDDRDGGRGFRGGRGRGRGWSEHDDRLGDGRGSRGYGYGGRGRYKGEHDDRVDDGDGGYGGGGRGRYRGELDGRVDYGPCGGSGSSGGEGYRGGSGRGRGRGWGGRSYNDSDRHGNSRYGGGRGWGRGDLRRPFDDEVVPPGGGGFGQRRGMDRDRDRSRSPMGRWRHDKFAEVLQGEGNGSGPQQGATDGGPQQQLRQEEGAPKPQRQRERRRWGPELDTPENKAAARDGAVSERDRNGAEADEDVDLGLGPSGKLEDELMAEAAYDELPE